MEVLEHWLTYLQHEVIAVHAPMLQPVVLTLQQWLSSVCDNIDPNYIQWLLYLFLPVLIAFVLPFVLLALIYASVVFLYMYTWRQAIKQAYATSYWDGARYVLAVCWDATGWLWHGYEMRGLEHIPDSGPCLIVFYHGATPIDVYYLIAKIILHKKRMLHTVGDKFIWKIPGLRILCDAFCVTPGTVDKCVETLERGKLLCVSPGGVREALFADPQQYDMLWANRLGFAKVVCKSKVVRSSMPVVTMFTENSREAFRVPGFFRRPWCRNLYERTRFPIALLYGGFPVKLRTHLSRPIVFDFDNLDAQLVAAELEQPDAATSTSGTEEERQMTERAAKVRLIIANSLQLQIDAHQRLPGSIAWALWDRLTCRVVRHRPEQPDVPSESEEEDSEEVALASELLVATPARRSLSLAEPLVPVDAPDNIVEESFSDDDGFAKFGDFGVDRRPLLAQSDDD